MAPVPVVESPKHAPARPRRNMTLLDATLLVGSGAVGFGLFEIVHRGLFQAGLGSWSTDCQTRPPGRQ